MDLYIRALNIYPHVVTMYVGLLVLDLLTILINRLLMLTNVRFMSKILPTYGWRLEQPFKFVRDDTHLVERKPNILPTVLTGFVVLLSAITMSYCALTCEGKDVYPYMYWGALQMLVSLALWYKHIQKFLAIRIHKEQLVVVENCQSLNNPYETVLLLQGYHNEFYTYVVPNTEHWAVGMYHKAECLGDYVTHLDDTSIDEEHAIWVGVGDKLAHTTWNSLALSILLFILGALAVGCYIYFHFISLLVFGVTSIAMGVIMMPWHKNKQLKLISITRSEVYDDIDIFGDFIYVLIGVNGRPYYYQCDDRDALTVNGSYQCETKGNIVLYVNEHSDKETGATYHPVDKVGGMVTFMLIILAGIITSEFLSFLPTAIGGSALLAVWFTMVIRYKTKGDI